MALLTNNRNLLSEELHKISLGILSPRDVLLEIQEEQLTDLLAPSFAKEEGHSSIGNGESILPGDVSGQLVLDRKLGEILLKEAQNRNTTIDLIYSLEGGDLEDFYVLTSSKGFFTNQKARTTFCPVQASCEGIPTLVNVNCKYQFNMETDEITYTFNDGSKFNIEQPSRRIIFENHILNEGAYLSLNSNKGLIFKGNLSAIPSTIIKVYQILSQAFMEALEIYGAKNAEQNIIYSSIYQNNKKFLIETIQSPEFLGFKKLLEEAYNISELKVLSTAHTTRTMTLTRMYGSDISILDGEVCIKSNSNRYGLGLLRDERMWNQTTDIDLMRIIFLGEEIVGESYLEYKDKYLQKFTSMVYDVFKVGTGEIAVVRLLCMPYNMIFTKEFDAKKFSKKYNLDEKAVSDRVKVLANESETYHGCRGVRVTVQRQDICQIWSEGVIKAAHQAYNEGINVKVQILLSMVTFPEEVSMFVETFEKLVESYGVQDLVRGVSIMIETSGAFHVLEDILDVKGENIELNGALFGGNDFTAACLNMNRADSAKSIIPEYVKLNIMPSSPFQIINEQIVGKAIVQGLRRTKLLKYSNGREYLMGLGGEIAGSWQSVKWLSKHAAPHGLNYVSTPPDRILFSLFASAQSVLQSLYSDI
ncbi:putative PEP-binding protein [Priestia flexa]|uniref:Pyruvate, phosphate dikinase n=1 Tax=Priestia flexa TaxID=86664 RepID=A0ABU4J7V7_9BACI|nr:putative PEP-binding protein [Priestia flexa]MDW8517042.1 putative PEP-binding protein [Priestia flexa]